MPRTVSFEPSTLEKLGTFLMQSGGVLGNVARQRVDDEEIRQRTLERLARMLEGLQGQQFQAQHLELQQQRLTAQQAEAERKQALEAQEQETVTGAMGSVTEEISPAWTQRLSREPILTAPLVTPKPDDLRLGPRPGAFREVPVGPTEAQIAPAETRERAPELPEILRRLAQAASRGRGVSKARLEDIKGLFPAEEKPSLEQFDPTRPVFRVERGVPTEIRPGVPAPEKPRELDVKLSAARKELVRLSGRPGESISDEEAFTFAQQQGREATALSQGYAEAVKQAIGLGDRPPNFTEFTQSLGRGAAPSGAATPPSAAGMSPIAREAFERAKGAGAVPKIGVEAQAGIVFGLTAVDVAREAAKLAIDPEVLDFVGFKTLLPGTMRAEARRVGGGKVPKKVADFQNTMQRLVEFQSRALNGARASDQDAQRAARLWPSLNTPPNEVPLRMRNGLQSLQFWTLQWAKQTGVPEQRADLEQFAGSLDSLIQRMDEAASALE